jgi:hypothetical protein
MRRCQAMTKAGRPCPNAAMDHDSTCLVHSGRAASLSRAGRAEAKLWQDKAERRAEESGLPTARGLVKDHDLAARRLCGAARTIHRSLRSSETRKKLLAVRLPESFLSAHQGMEEILLMRILVLVLGGPVERRFVIQAHTPPAHHGTGQSPGQSGRCGRGRRTRK